MFFFSSHDRLIPPHRLMWALTLLTGWYVLPGGIPALADETEALRNAPILGNPMERHFTEPDTVAPLGARQGRIRAAFSDSTAPRTVQADAEQPATTSGEESEHADPVRAPILQTGTNDAQADTSSNTTAGWNQLSTAPPGAAWNTDGFGANPASVDAKAGNPTGNATYSNTPGASNASPYGSVYGNFQATQQSPLQNQWLLAQLQQQLLAARAAKDVGNPYAGWNGTTSVPSNLPTPDALSNSVYGSPHTGLYGNPYADPYANAYGNPAFNPYAQAVVALPNGAYGNPYDPSYNPYADPYGGQYVTGNAWYGGLGGTNPPDSYAEIAQRQQVLIAQLMEAARKQEAREKSEENGEEDTGNGGWSLDNIVPLKISSPLAETLWTGAGYMSPFSGSDQPDKGVGQPLKMRYWTDRPYYFGAFCGYISPSELMSGSLTTIAGTTNVRIRQETSGMGGLTLGWNFHHYWGLEGRLHFTSFNLRYDYDDPSVVMDRQSGSDQITTCDVSVHYYPLGNSKWRPYFKYGLGLAALNFTHFDGTSKKAATMAMPVGIGLKYWWTDRLALNVDLVDNIIFGVDGTKTQSNWAFTCGITYAYGRNKSRRPTAYWPYTPSGKK